MAENLTRKFQQLQEERTKTFHQLDEDHRVFLATAPDYENGFDDYKKAVNECTERFKLISKEIIKIRESLEKDNNKLASLIGKVQELEENKLRIVCDLQLARFISSSAVLCSQLNLLISRQQALDNPGDALCEKNADMIKAVLVNLEQDITDTLTEVRYEIVDIDSPA